MPEHYILDGHKTVAEPDLMTWAVWIETADRTVAKTELADCEVSTVFLGLNHNWGSGPAVLFETMVFGGAYDQEQWRYSTWEEAETGHNVVVALVQADAP